MIIDCLKIRDNLRVRDDYSKKVTAVFIQVGNNAESSVYINQKKKLCEQYEIEYIHAAYSETITEEKLIDNIKSYNNDKNITAIMVQLPLPKGISEDAVINAIDPVKDLDGFTNINKGKVMLGDPTAIVPCTPLGIMRLLRAIKFNLVGKNVVVVGRSNIVGKPITQLLINAGATVTCCNSNTPQDKLKELILNSDLVVTAINKPVYFNKEFFGEKNLDKLSNIVAIDVGIFRIDGKLEGNIDKELYNCFKAITPVPKGVGPLTVSSVVSNIEKCRQLQEYKIFEIKDMKEIFEIKEDMVLVEYVNREEYLETYKEVYNNMVMKRVGKKNA